MKEKELLELASYLETSVLAEKWMFSYWGYRDNSKEDVTSLNVCSSAGCALGHCTVLWPNVFALEFHENVHAGRVRLRGTKLINWKAAAKFFDIGRDTAEGLFTPLGYTDVAISQVTPTMVANKIRKLVSGDE